MKALINPFEYYSEKVLLCTGLLGLCAAAFFVSNNDLLFLGSLKVVMNHPVSFFGAFINICINLLINTLVLLVFAWFINRKTRVIDIFNTVLIAHLIIYILAVITVLPIVNRSLDEIEKLVFSGSQGTGSAISTQATIILLTVGILSLVLLAYFFYFLIRGTKVACNSKKRSHSILIVLLILIVNTVLQFVNPYL